MQIELLPFYSSYFTCESEFVINSGKNTIKMLISLFEIRLISCTFAQSAQRIYTMSVYNPCSYHARDLILSRRSHQSFHINANLHGWMVSTLLAGCCDHSDSCNCTSIWFSFILAYSITCVRGTKMYKMRSSCYRFSLVHTANCTDL